MINILPALFLFAFLLFLVLGAYCVMRLYRPSNLFPQILNDTIFSEMMDLAVILAPDGRIRKVSKSTEMLLGYNAGELLDQFIGLIIQDESLIHDLMCEKRAPAICRYDEIPFLTKSGKFLPVKVSCLPLISGKGMPDGIVHEKQLLSKADYEMYIMKNGAKEQ